MLSLPEKVVFVILTIISLYLTWHSFGQVAAVIRRGNGPLHLNGLARRLFRALEITITQRTVLNARPLTSALHAAIAWGFLFYLLVNLGDVLEGFLADYAFPGTNGLANAYRLLADVLSVAVILSMIYFLVRRFIAGDPRLTFRPDILLHPDVAAGGIRRDSAIVGAFILGHVGARFLGQALATARRGPDAFQPFASAVGSLFTRGNPALLEVGEHAMFWLAIGLILIFVPWFPRTKHFHLLLAPFNYLTRPEQRSAGAMAPLPLDDETIERFGAERIEHLSRTQIIDAYACIMCNRCQDVCPAYSAGTPLSPAALEVNKRYFLRQHGTLLASGGESPATLFESALSTEGVWACTACAACVEICPVGNEPLADILAMRQHLVLMEGRPPDRLAGALTRAERAGNPWGHPRGTRLDWATGLNVPLLADRRSVDVLYWVGCAGAYDPAGQRVSRAMIQILRAAGVDFAVLGEEERCTCEWARRSGQEALYQETTAALIDIFNRYTFNLIVTQCPHCYHTFRNEYPDFGGHYAVTHHSVHIASLLRAGRLKLQKWDRRRHKEIVTYHDPCFLGRYNNEYDAPREALLALESVTLAEMPRRRQRSLCCGGGGAQVWMEVHQEHPINAMRLEEANATGAQTVTVACPFCAIMLNSAADSTGKPALNGNASIRVSDIAELIAGRLSL